MVHSGLNKLNAAAVHGHIGRADSLFHQLRSDIPVESRRTWHNTRLKACANAGSADLAVKYFEEMLEEGIAPNGRTFGKLMEAATKQTNRQEAQRWFRAHTNAHGQVQGLHIHMLVDAAAREGDFRAAEAWFRRFSTDTVLAPNIWEALLCSAARAGDAELAEELFLESTKATAAWRDGSIWLMVSCVLKTRSLPWHMWLRLPPRWATWKSHKTCSNVSCLRVTAFHRGQTWMARCTLLASKFRGHLP